MSEQPGERTITTSDNTTRHRCYLCNRTYERQDHLSRHLRSHDNDRTYRCPDCGKGFNRADLLNRHRTAHARGSSENYRRRTGHACEACIKAKTKCDDARPCKRCKTRDIPCQNVDNHRPSHQLDESPNGILRRILLPTDRQPSSPPAQEQPSFSLDDAQQFSTDPSNNSLEDAALLLGMNFLAPTSNGLGESSVVHNSLDCHDAGVGGLGGHIDYFEYIMMSDATAMNASSGAPMPPDVSDFTQDLDLDGCDLDFSFLAGGLTRPSSAQDKQTTEVHSNTFDHQNNDSDAQRRTEAFKRSPWSWHEWIPVRGARPFQGQDEEEINIHDDRVDPIDQMTSPAHSLSTCCNISQEARDRMIRVVTQVSGDRLSMPSFPSLELLEDLIDIMLLQDSIAIDSYIHATSFDCTTSRTETLLGMVAAGARYIALAPVWKMGLIFQEVTRLATASLYENDNSMTRDLQAIQASLLWLEVGTWSGFRRKTEIAASFLQPVITMLGWANRFSGFRYVDIVPLIEDDEDALETKWKSWAEQEGFKRTVIHAFLYDSQEAMVHMRNPLISVAQMLLPLPASKDLWLAPNADAWRNLYLKFSRTSQETNPSLVNVLGDTNILERTATVDKPLCLLFACHAIAHETWSYRQQTRILVECNKDGRSDRWLAHLSWQRSLYDDLTRMHAYCEMHHNDLTEILFTVNFLLMCLHVTLEDIQTFSGKSGEVEARKIFPRIRAWAEDAQSRTAIWHAGQVFRFARIFEQTRLRDFYAVALYHSALTLWVYGRVTSNVTRRSGLQTPVQSTSIQASRISSLLLPQRVLVNSADEKSMRAFTLLGLHIPFLKDAASAEIAVSDAKGVMAVAEDLLKSNFPQSRNGLPPLIDKLVNLMNELGRLSGG